MRRHCQDVQDFTFVKSPDTTAYRQTQSGSYVEDGIGDITKLHVHAIVSASNHKLIHVGGNLCNFINAGVIHYAISHSAVIHYLFSVYP